MTVRITGDVHGMVAKYADMILDSEVEYSIQVGDMGFNYSDLEILDHKCHKFFGGNHDNYHIYKDCPHALGNYGAKRLGDLEYYFIRGAFSIDKKYRLERERKLGVISWWGTEQLSKSQREKAFDSYAKAKPSVMMTHTCPSSISKLIGSPGCLKAFGFDPDTFETGTQNILQKCFDYHKPDVWIFGHFHRTIDFHYRGTRFICLGELRHIDYKDGEFINNNVLDSVRQI